MNVHSFTSERTFENERKCRSMKVQSLDPCDSRTAVLPNYQTTPMIVVYSHRTLRTTVCPHRPPRTVVHPYRPPRTDEKKVIYCHTRDNVCFQKTVPLATCVLGNRYIPAFENALKSLPTGTIYTPVHSVSDPYHLAGSGSGSTSGNVDLDPGSKK